MITLVIGKKGSGKTKRLINLANEASEKTNGNVVFIEKGLKLTYDVSHKARLIDTDQYGINGFAVFYGFICGICAGNYDVTDIFVDSTLSICSKDLTAFEDFLKNVGILSKDAGTNFILSVSADESELPKGVNSICEII